MNSLVRQLLVVAIGVLVTIGAASHAAADTTYSKTTSLGLYTFEVMAESGGVSDGLASSPIAFSTPSINNNGVVAYICQDSIGSTLCVTGVDPPYNGVMTRAARPEVPARRFQSGIQITNAGSILAADLVSGPLYVLQTWSGVPDATLASVLSNISEAAPGGSPVFYDYDAIFAYPSINNIGQSAFIAQGRHVSSLASSCTQASCLVTPGVVARTFNELPIVSPARPQIADNGNVVVRYQNTALTPPLLPVGSKSIRVYDYALDTFTTIADEASGWLKDGLGMSPGISDDGTVVAFIGDRGFGPGVFIFLLDDPSLGVIRVAGEGGADLGFQNNDATGGSFGAPITFTSFDANSRVAVIRRSLPPDGPEGDAIVVSFIGTPSAARSTNGYVPGVPFTQNLGLWTRRVDIRRPAVRDGKPVGAIHAELSAVLKVLQVGDGVPMTPTTGDVVTGLQVNDQIAQLGADIPLGSDGFPDALRYGDHQLAFSVTTGTNQYVLRASLNRTVVLNVRRLSQGNPWNIVPYNKYDSHGACTIAQKGCFLSSVTTVHDYAVDHYTPSSIFALADSSFKTPPQANALFVANGGFDSAPEADPSLVSSASTCPSWSVHEVALMACTTPASCAAAMAAMSSTEYAAFLAKRKIEAPNLDPESGYKAALGASAVYPNNFVFQPITGTLPGLQLVDGDAASEALKARVGTLGLPVILDVGNHYLVAAGVADHRIIVADPGCAGREYLDSTTTCGLGVPKKVKLRGYVIDPPDSSRLVIATEGAATVSVSDSAGDMTGITADGMTHTDIPNSYYVIDNEEGSQDPDTGEIVGLPHATITVDLPSSTTYTLRVAPLTDATVGVRVTVVSADGVPSKAAEITQAGASSGTATYSIVPNLGSGLPPVVTPVGGVTVPTVVGQSQAVATAAIVGAGLAVGTVSTTSSDSVSAGDVISQNPSGGTSVVSGSAVDLVISSGPALVTVPDVAGQTQAAATAAITDAGLTVGTVSSASSPSVPAGNVVSQNPAAGSSAASGSAVDLVISSGPALVAVPDVTGQSQAAATAAITGAGLTVGGVTHQPSVTVPAGSVISESPTAGTSVALGSTVSLVISSGPVPGDLNGDGSVGCDDLNVVKAAFGKSVGQAGYDPRADINHDGVVNILDLSAEARLMPAGTVCH